MHAIQKIVQNGNSAQITLPRALLFFLGLLPGEKVYLWTTEDGVCHFRRFQVDTDVSSRSPGILTDKPAMVKP